MSDNRPVMPTIPTSELLGKRLEVNVNSRDVIGEGRTLGEKGLNAAAQVNRAEGLGTSIIANNSRTY